MLHWLAIKIKMKQIDDIIEIGCVWSDFLIIKRNFSRERILMEKQEIFGDFHILALNVSDGLGGESQCF